MQTKELGNNGEQLVCSLLEEEQFTIVKRNYTTRWGEIDIIAQRDELMVFVEVKTRKQNYFPTSMVVNYTKQRKIIKTAKIFVVQNSIKDKVLRFDVATVQMNDAKQSIQYIPNAFTERIQ